MAGGEVARVLEHGAAIAPPRRREGEEGRVRWEAGRGEVTRRGSEGGGGAARRLAAEFAGRRGSPGVASASSSLKQYWKKAALRWWSVVDGFSMLIWPKAPALLRARRGRREHRRADRGGLASGGPFDAAPVFRS